MTGVRMAGALDIPDWMRAWLEGMTAFDFLLLVVGIVMLITGGWFAVTRVWPWVQRASHFFDDWFGEEARPGQLARPGVMERLQNVESGQIELSQELKSQGAVLAAQGRKLDAVHHEVFPNSGRSFRDRADQTRHVARAIAERVGVNLDDPAIYEDTENPKENR